MLSRSKRVVLMVLLNVFESLLLVFSLLFKKKSIEHAYMFMTMMMTMILFWNV